MAKNKKSFKGAGADLFLTPDPTATQTEKTQEKLIINPVFKTLIPPLSEEEYAQLEENLQENGIREAISIWGNTIIDGHNRYEIATRHNLPYTTVSYEFDNEDDVKLWVFKNQIGRRNLPAFERVRLALHLKPVIAEKAKARQTRKSANFVPQISAEQNSDNFVLQISAEQNPVDTRRVIADISGVSHDTVTKVEKILNAATPETLEKIKRGEITVNRAYQETKSQERRANIINSDADSHSSFDDASIFSVIYADPPWELKILDNEIELTSFKTYSIKFEELKKIAIPSSDDAVLFLWSYASILDKALQLMSTWGFKYQTNIIWDKRQSEVGQYIRNQHELLLIGTKGNFSFPTEDSHFCSIYSEKASNQNTKPKWFYEQIEKMLPNEMYFELFASSKHNNRWAIAKNLTISEEVNSK